MDRTCLPAGRDPARMQLGFDVWPRIRPGRQGSRPTAITYVFTFYRYNSCEPMPEQKIIFKNFEDMFCVIYLKRKSNKIHYANTHFGVDGHRDSSPYHPG